MTERDVTKRSVAVPLWLALLFLAPAVARPAETDLPGLDGGRLTASDLAEGPHILVVWASWSPRCRDVVPRVNALARRWSARARVATVVFQEEAEAVRRFLDGQHLEVPVYLDVDGSFSKQHAVVTLPGLLVFRDGRADFLGKLPPNPGPVLERALAEQPR